jgi:DNA gyrase/topoisomerase IV subunit A
MNLRELIVEFIEFRMEVVIRRAKFELRKAEERAHILEGYLKALDHLDEVIALIRGSKNTDEAREKLVEKCCSPLYLPTAGIEPRSPGNMPSLFSCRYCLSVNTVVDKS